MEWTYTRPDVMLGAGTVSDSPRPEERLIYLRQARRQQPPCSVWSSDDVWEGSGVWDVKLGGKTGVWLRTVTSTSSFRLK